jgi:hypothetical protein
MASDHFSYVLFLYCLLDMKTFNDPDLLGLIQWQLLLLPSFDAFLPNLEEF